jgi:hypothetical protein
LPFIPAAPSKRDFRFAPTSLQSIQAKANKNETLEAISKIGFWFKVKAGPMFNPQAY